jgi:periplasmic copper chaperone A
MNHVRPVALAIFAIAALSGAALQADESAVTITNAWARATPGKAPNGAAYLTVTNSGATPDRLVGASSPVAATAELHEDKEEDGIMKMRPVAALAIAPGQSITLKPGAYHFMLTGLKAPLKQGASFPLTLTFENSGVKEVQVAVERAGAMTGGGMAAHDMPGHDMGGMTHDMGSMHK